MTCGFSRRQRRLAVERVRQEPVQGLLDPDVAQGLLRGTGRPARRPRRSATRSARRRTSAATTSRNRPAPTSPLAGSPPTAASRTPATARHTRRSRAATAGRAGSPRLGHDPEADHRERRDPADDVTRTRAITASPAANLPLTTSSRWIGCERSRGRVPWPRSPLIAVEREGEAQQRPDDARNP